MSETEMHSEIMNIMKYGSGSGETRRGRDLLGLPIYTIAEGKHLGEISALLVRREDYTVPFLRLRLAIPGKEAFLSYDSLKTVGVDIGLVETQTALMKEMPTLEQGTLEPDLPGRPVFTKGGESAGQLAGFVLDTANGKIAFFRVETKAGFLSKLVAMGQDSIIEVPTDMVLSLGPDAVIVDDEVKAMLHRDEGGKATEISAE